MSNSRTSRDSTANHLDFSGEEMSKSETFRAQIQTLQAELMSAESHLSESRKREEEERERHRQTLKQLHLLQNEEILDDDSVVQLQGSPRLHLIMAALAFAVGFSTVGFSKHVTDPALDKMNSVSGTFKEAIHTVPVLVGGAVRVWGGKESDRNGGHRATLVMLAISLLGALGLFVSTQVIPSSEQVASATNSSWLPWSVLICNALAQFGVSTFSCCLAAAAFTGAPKDISKRQGIVAGFGNGAPTIVVLMYAVVSLKAKFVIWILMDLVGFVVVLFCGFDSYFHQLRHQGASLSQARSLGKKHGQTQFPSRHECGIWEELKLNHFSARQRRIVHTLMFAYFVNFGGFLMYVLRGQSLLEHTLAGTSDDDLLVSKKTAIEAIMGTFLFLGGATRFFCGFVDYVKENSRWAVLISLTMCGISGCLFGFANDSLIAICTTLFVLAIFVGIGNYSIFALLNEHDNRIARWGVVAGMIGASGVCGCAILSWVFFGIETWSSSKGHYARFVVPVLSLLSAFLVYKLPVGPGDEPSDSESPRSPLGATRGSLFNSQFTGITERTSLRTESNFSA